jgi:uncharacterized protein YcbX
VNQQQSSSAVRGTVVSLWRYPVKSMMGEELNSSYVSERGIIGDRTYAIVDKQTGKAASAKNPRKWGKLFDFRSIFIDSSNGRVNNIPPVRITFPDGSKIFSDRNEGDDMNSRLSEVFNTEVKLMRASDLEEPSYEEYWPDIDGLARRDQVTDESMPSKTFFDIAVIHILTTSTINRLRELYQEGRFEVRRFRPNIVVESAAASEEKKNKNDFIENSWVGKKMTIGKDIVLNVTAPCTRCVMITLPQGDLPQDLGILSTVAKYNQIHVGVYASVEHGGTIHRGDTLQIEEK